MNKLVFTVVFALAACATASKPEDKPTPAQPAASPAPTAPTSAATPAVPAGPRNLARDYILAQDPEATCTVYHQHEGPSLTDSALCTLKNKHVFWAQVDTVSGPKLLRIDALSEEELKAIEAQKAAAAAQQAQAQQAQVDTKAKKQR